MPNPSILARKLRRMLEVRRVDGRWMPALKLADGALVVVDRPGHGYLVERAAAKQLIRRPFAEGKRGTD